MLHLHHDILRLSLGKLPLLDFLLLLHYLRKYSPTQVTLVLVTSESVWFLRRRDFFFLGVCSSPDVNTATPSPNATLAHALAAWPHYNTVPAKMEIIFVFLELWLPINRFIIIYGFP
jgi:hypothetical protein